MHELAKRLTGQFRVIALGPHAPGASVLEVLDGVEIHRYRYAPERWETLVNDGGIVANLRRSRWKLLLVPGFVLVQGWWAWRIMRRLDVDVIHAHWLLPQGLIAALLQSLPGRKVPFVVTSHGADLYALRGRMLASLKRFVLRKASAATVVSGAMRERLQAMGTDMAKVSVQPMGVDMEERFTPGQGAERSQWEILFVGRLVEKKGLRFLLDAMPRALQHVPGAKLTIAGFGPEEAALRSQAHALGLEASVRFIGAVPQTDLPALYRRAALFVAPFVRATSGDEEGLGLVLVEAIGCGCPILVGNVPAVTEVLGHGYGDMAVDVRDAEQLSERITAVLSDPVGARTRATQLRSMVQTRFDWKTVAESYSRLLAATD
ncbi:glycosyltransferase [Luteimonas sp. A482]